MPYWIRFEGHRLAVGCDIAAPAPLVWRWIADTRFWPRWGPSVRGVVGRGRRLHEGYTGRVETVLGLGLPFRVTGFEEGRYWGWTVGGVSATGHRVTPLSGGRCRLAFTLPVWAAPYGVVCLLALRNLRRIARRSTASRGGWRGGG
jgi:hypothetical protein